MTTISFIFIMQAVLYGFLGNSLELTWTTLERPSMRIISQWLLFINGLFVTRIIFHWLKVTPDLFPTSSVRTSVVFYQPNRDGRCLTCNRNVNRLRIISSRIRNCRVLRWICNQPMRIFSPVELHWNFKANIHRYKSPPPKKHFSIKIVLIWKIPI